MVIPETFSRNDFSCPEKKKTHDKTKSVLHLRYVDDMNETKSRKTIKRCLIVLLAIILLILHATSHAAVADERANPDEVDELIASC